MRPHPPSRWLARALGLAALLVCGCVVSPQPEPPAIEASLLSLESRTAGAPPSLVGAAGAVTPGGSVLRMLDLDTTAPGTSLTVAADGSFSLALSSPSSDEYRLQAFFRDLRSDPLDVTGVDGIALGPGALFEVKRPLAGCFLLAPALEIGPLAPSTTATVTMTNSCTGDVTLGGFSLRAGSPAFTVAPATGPLVVPVGGKASFTVTFDPHPGDPTEDVLFVEIDAPEKGRRALTLRGQTP